MTTNFEINHKLRFINQFIGCYPRDQLPVIKSFPVALIANTDTLDGGGKHWVAIYINENRFGEYFDSYGLQPLNEEFRLFLDNTCTNGWIYNQVMLQGITSFKCGQFCVLFIFLRAIDIPMLEVVKLFSDNHDVNDEIVEKLYKELV